MDPKSKNATQPFVYYTNKAVTKARERDFLSLLNASFTSCRRSGHICDICTIKFTKETHYNFKPISSCMKSKRKCVPAITLPTQFRTRAKTKNQLCFLPLLTSSLHRMESCSFSYQIKLLMGAHGNGGDYGVCAVPTWRAANVH